MSGTTQSPIPPVKHDPYAALRIPNYRLYVLGWFIALVGGRIQAVAVSWEMYQRTHEALSLGLVGLAQALPTMLLALPAGYLADKFNRPRLMILSLYASMLTALALAVWSYLQGPAYWVYILLCLDATANILGRPARVALVPQLVPRHVFPNAATWNTSLLQISFMIGPALGGVIVGLYAPVAYICAVVGSLFFLVLLSRLHLSDDVKRGSGSPLQMFREGIRYVWDERIILTMISLDMFAVLLGGAVYLLPIYAQDILKVGAVGFGWLRAAPAAGAFCMAALLIYLPPLRRAGWSLLLAVAGFGIATIIFGLATSFWLAFAMLFLTGVFDNISVVIRQTLLQLLTPEEMRGRVSAVSSVFISASNELGGMESGLVAQWFGPVFSVVSGGIGTLIVVIIAGFASSELRAFGALHEARPRESNAQTSKPTPA